LFSAYRLEDDRVLDTHAGSASSFVAAYELGLDYIGFEIDQHYFSAAQERIEAVMAQVRLF
jgi:site-specific DNA-methyltransferase (adenine-specific)